MSDDFDWDKEFADDPDYQALSAEERARLISVMEKMLDWGMGAVYGDENEGVPDADVDCAARIPRCKAKCCTFIFALTKEEVAAGRIAYNTERPYFIARDPTDGYCPHMDRATCQCTVWEERPLRCRRYDCSDDPNVWPELAAGKGR